MSAVVICILVIILVCLGLMTAISCGFVVFITKPRRTQIDQSIEFVKKQNVWENYDSIDKEEWNITNEQGYLLNGILLKNQGKKLVICTHGYTDTRYGCVKYANVFYELGYNVYIYDIRHHGANKDCYCSMGYYESRDVVAVTKAVRERFGCDWEIGLFGESLGSASSILALGVRQDYKFLVSDCGFSDMGELMEYQAHTKFHLPLFLCHTSSFMNKICHGYSFYSVRPKDALKDNKVPILFIHGTDDTFIPPKMCQDMYELASCKKEIHLFEHAEHASSYISNPEFYRKTVKNFLSSLDEQSE